MNTLLTLKEVREIQLEHKLHAMMDLDRYLAMFYDAVYDLECNFKGYRWMGGCQCHHSTMCWKHDKWR